MFDEDSSGGPTGAFGDDLDEIGADCTAAQRAFLEAFGLGPPFFDVWLHEDEDGTPWLIVSSDLARDNRVVHTLRVDYDERGYVIGGRSPAFLNWDDGVRAPEAEISGRGPGELFREGTPKELATAARSWLLLQARELGF